MIVWDKIHETSELKYLFLKEINIDNCDRLQKDWAKIYNEYLLEFGLSDRYKNILELKKQIAIKQANFIETSDRIWITYVNLDKETLKVLNEKTEKVVNFKENITSIEKIQGVRINPLRITALEYFNYLKHLSNG